MNISQKAKWERTRAGGFWRYILLYWILIFGGAMIAVKSVFNYLFTGWGFRLESMAIEAPITLITAFAFGSIIWLISENRYRKSL
jgi:hypothetical protein